jgi:hypothetical protein
MVLVRDEETLALYDPARSAVVGSTESLQTRDAVWSADGRFVALLSKGLVRVCDRTMAVLASVSETVHVKGCVPPFCPLPSACVRP